MADDSLGFLTDLTQEVAATATATGALTRTVLVENLASRLVESEELQDWSPCFFEGRGSRNRLIEIDGYCIEGPCEGLALRRLHVREQGGDLFVSSLPER